MFSRPALLFSPGAVLHVVFDTNFSSFCFFVSFQFFSHGGSGLDVCWFFVHLCDIT